MAVGRQQASEFDAVEVEACQQVLVEFIGILSDYKDNVVLVGGWVPFFLCPGASEPHIGSLDVDFAFNFRQIAETAYETILQRMEGAGYYQTAGKMPFMWFRDVKIAGRKITVEVDLLSGEYGGTGTRHRHQNVQDAKALKARACDLAFERHETIPLDGNLPGGAKRKVNCRIAGIVPFLAMKGNALAGRAKKKDAYDIDYVIRHFPGGQQALVAAFDADKENALVREGLGKIKAAFSSPEHYGPQNVVAFRAIEDEDQAAIFARDSFERVSAFLEALKIVEVID